MAKRSEAVDPEAVGRSEKIKELGGLFFVLSAMFLFISLISYDPGDVAGFRYPVNDPLLNKGGKIGVWLGHALLTNLGLASYVLVFFVAFWSFKVFFRRQISGLYVKIVSAATSVLATATLLAMLPTRGGLEAITPGAGGLYGEASRIFLTMNLGAAGAILAVTLGLAISLILSTDWLLYSGLATIGRGIAGLIDRLRDRARQDQQQPLVEAVRQVEREAHKLPAPVQIVPTPRYAEPARPVEILNPVTVGPPIVPQKDPFQAAAAAHVEHKKAGPYEQPPIDLFDSKIERIHGITEKDIKDRMLIIENTLREYGITVRVVNYEVGPAVTTYELELSTGTPIHSVVARADEISMRLAVPPVRIVAPIPNKSTIGIEVPNPFPNTVRMREFLDKSYNELRKIPLPILLGKTNSGEPLVKSLADMPHMLIAGATGSGKSVCLKSIISSLIISMSWDEMKLLLIDPKMVELTAFSDIPHLWAPVVTDNKKASLVLDWLVKEMDERYIVLNKTGVGHIEKFNKLGEKKVAERLKEAGIPEEQIKTYPTYMPYIVTVIDELADLMMTARKEVEHSIIRLSQKARAIGIHLVVATQRPSTDVITGLIRSNMPARIGFKVASQIESRIILDKKGAERLLGKGDMLLVLPGSFDAVRAQCTFTSDDEIRGVVTYLKGKGKPEYHQQLVEIESVADMEGTDKDELFDDAVQIILEQQRGSVSLLQRHLQIGYSRAARLIDAMEKFGIVGAYNGSSARDVLLTLEQWEQRRNASSGPR